jgi:hypothetical protein
MTFTNTTDDLLKVTIQEKECNTDRKKYERARQKREKAWNRKKMSLRRPK